MRCSFNSIFGCNKSIDRFYLFLLTKKNKILIFNISIGDYDDDKTTSYLGKQMDNDKALGIAMCRLEPVRFLNCLIDF